MFLLHLVDLATLSLFLRLYSFTLLPFTLPVYLIVLVRPPPQSPLRLITLRRSSFRLAFTPIVPLVLLPITINFLSLLHPASSLRPAHHRVRGLARIITYAASVAHIITYAASAAQIIMYAASVVRTITYADQQASIFLQQKLKIGIRLAPDRHSLKAKWAARACHEMDAIVVQVRYIIFAFENLAEIPRDENADELLGQGGVVFGEVAKHQWDSYCIQYILEHSLDEHLLAGLLEYATNERGSKSVVKVLKEGGKDTLDRVVQSPRRVCGLFSSPCFYVSTCSMTVHGVDLALSLTGSRLVASADKGQRTLLYGCIRGHIVTLRGCKTGKKVIWLFDRMGLSELVHPKFVDPTSSSSPPSFINDINLYNCNSLGITQTPRNDPHTRHIE
ncbi:hypothetical protein C8R44DRAFT_892533 [Mycena epipterygia]|nr:hypothetical protein C8R44DRAFT_892533 [Mycena epipterygia]